MTTKKLIALLMTTSMASSASAALATLLSDPVSATATGGQLSAGSVVRMFYDGNETLADLGTTANRGGQFVPSTSNGDDYTGDTIRSNVLVYDMGSAVSFSGFVHSQRKADAIDAIATIQFWVTDTDPGVASSTVADNYFGTTPQATANLVTVGGNVLTGYELGTELTGRYVVMRLIAAHPSTGQAGGYTLQLAQVATVGGVDADTSTVVTSPTSVPANGTTSSTVTVTLKDASDNPVSGRLVSLTNTAGPQTAVITAVRATTNVFGEATFTVSSTTPGTEEFTATDVDDSIEITLKASVDFTTPVVDEGTSTVVASPTSVPAHDSIFSVITVTLKDAASQPVPGKTVTLEGDTGDATVSLADPGQTTTDSDGRIFFSVKSTIVGTEVFTATNVTDGGMVITDTASVEFTTMDPNAFVVLGDPISSSTSNAQASFPVGNLYDGSPTFADVGTSAKLGGKYIASGTDSDGVDGKGHTVVFDMVATASFNAFLYAQRKNTVVDAVGSIEFWATDTNPGNAATTSPLPIISTTPDATVEITFTTDELLHDYYLDGTLTGRYVVMRLIAHPSATGSTGGYELALGRRQAPSRPDYHTWALGYPGLGAAGDDDDGDGLTNDEERLFGLDPTSGASINPFTIPLDPVAGTLSFTRRDPSLTGKFTDVETSTDLMTWTVDAGAGLVAGTPDANGIQTVAVTLSPSLLTVPKLFARVSQRDAAALLSENFDEGDGGFTGLTTAGSAWVWGNPDSDGLGGTVTGGNGESPNCWGTNLGTWADGTGDPGYYINPTVAYLRSVEVDLTNVAAAELTFAEALDLEANDRAVVNIIESATDTVISSAIYTAVDADPLASAWAPANGGTPIPIPAAAIGKKVRIEWCLDGVTDDYFGWYIDDVTVQELAP